MDFRKQTRNSLEVERHKSEIPHAFGTLEESRSCEGLNPPACGINPSDMGVRGIRDKREDLAEVGLAICDANGWKLVLQ